MGKQTRVTSLKKKKKSWVMILAPKEFKNVELGKTMAYETESVVGRTIKSNYSVISGDPKKQNVELVFKIISAKDSIANTELLEYKMWVAYIKRLVKKAKTKIEDSFTCKTKDNFKIQIKIFVVTKNMVSRLVETTIRKKIQENFKLISEKRDFTDLVQDLINYSIQKEFRSYLKAITPLASFEVRWLTKVKA